jgi:hypothetical protein
MQVSERKTRHGDFIPPYTPGGRPDPHSDRRQEQIALMMQPYKGYFIEGDALLVHPFSPDLVCWRQRFGVGPFRFNHCNHALSASSVHREHERTG